MIHNTSDQPVPDNSRQQLAPSTARRSDSVRYIGGHGKIALLATPLLRQAGHRVASVIRQENQAAAVMTDRQATSDVPRVLIDCDPGIDDTLALAYLVGLHRLGSIELVGVTTTGGNVSTAATARNARWILNLLGAQDIPVAPGLPGPVDRPLVTTPETHGEHGLGKLQPPPVAQLPVAANWEELWEQEIDRLIITGPLTNAAHRVSTAGADSLAPDICVMGGAIEYPGNTTATAEWNFWVDPLAARTFFQASYGRPAPPRLCQLGLTEEFTLSPDRLRSLPANPLTPYLEDLLSFYFEFHQQQGIGYLAQIHDLLATAVGLGRVSYQATARAIVVDSSAGDLRGTARPATVADPGESSHQGVNAEIVTQVSHQEIWDDFALALKAL